MLPRHLAPISPLTGLPARGTAFAEGSGAFTSPLPSMLELSAATRAVAAEDRLAPAIAVLEREARRLTRSSDATVVMFERDTGAVWTLDGTVISEEVYELVSRVAHGGQREVYGHAMLEPVGAAPARAVLVLRRASAARFEREELTLVAALVGGVAATVNRLLAARAARPSAHAHELLGELP